MSADQSRLRSAIQRIAKEDPELRGATDAAKSRGDQPGGTGVGESDGERDRICCDGSTSDNANPGADTRDPSESAKDGLDPDDPADISDNLSGVVDCETGQPICFEGSDWIPPEGWGDARTPPPDPLFQPGFVWSASSGLFASPSAWVAICAGPNCCLSACPSGDLSVETTAEDGTPDSYRYTALCGDIPGGCRGSAITNRKPEEDGDEPLDVEASWPEDGCVNLSIKAGQIVGSKYDPENDSGYSAPRDEIELCDLENGARTLVRADTGSTWKSIKALDGDIDPDAGYGYLYDTASGKKIRQVSPSEFRDNTV